MAIASEGNKEREEKAEATAADGELEDGQEDHYFYQLEVPSCIESLASSAEQLQQLAASIGQYYIKTLLAYGCAYEPSQPSASQSTPTVANGKTRGDPQSQVASMMNTNLNGRQQATKRQATVGDQQENLDLNEIDAKLLESLDSVQAILPFLNELTSFVERCFATVESTLKRSTYYLNKASSSSSSSNSNNKSLGSSILISNRPPIIKESGEFQLTPDTKIHPIFIALMDLFYGLVSLDKTIRTHTNICRNLTKFKIICQLVIKNQKQESAKDNDNNNHKRIPNDLSELPRQRLLNLVDFIGNIQLTLCNEKRTIFQQCLEQIRHLNLHLSKDKTNKGYRNLCEQFEEFLLFFGENLIVDPASSSNMMIDFRDKRAQTIYLLNLNLIPNLYMANSEPRKVFGLISLLALYDCLFKKQEKRVCKMFSSLLLQKQSKTTQQQNINLIPLLGSNCYLLLSQFSLEHLPKFYLDSKVLKQLANQSDQLLKMNTVSEFERLSMKVVPWLVKFKAELIKANKSSSSSSSNANSHDESLWQRPLAAEQCQQRILPIQLFRQGLALIEEINHIVKSVIAIYSDSGQPMTRTNLVPLLRMVSLLKSIDVCLRQSKLFVYTCAIQIEHSIRVRWRKLMELARKRLISINYSDRKLDTTSALKLLSISSTVDYLANASGQTILSFCLPMLIPSLDSNEQHSINELLAQLIPDVYQQLQLSSNCGFLYWSWPTFGAYYSHSFEENPSSICELQYFHLALDDIPSVLLANQLDQHSSSCCCKNNQPPTHCRAQKALDLSWLAGKRGEFLSKLGIDLMEQFKTDFLDKICQEFEIELRLQIYRDLKLDGHNNQQFLKRHLYNFKQIFSTDSIQHSTATTTTTTNQPATSFKIFNQPISLRYHVEQHLNKVCYNLTAIAPHDWFTYDSMINLARHKFNLEFVNSQLPSQTLDSGLDLMDITRNLALFVQRYSYDLINQSFVEKCTNQSRFSTGSMVASSMLSGFAGPSANQSLNVVQVRHIARSIQTHGYGLLNSSVNCTYQLMKRLVNLFSKQIADDKLRAILTKEYQYLVMANGPANSRSPIGKRATISFDRATRMIKRLRSSVASGSIQAATDSQQQQQQQQQQQLSLGSLDLDSIRQSISQLGNALAFIRMLKSGALNCASESANYLPELDNLGSLRLSKLVGAEFGHFKETSSLSKAAKNFDQCLANYDENFSPKTNYFNIIIGLFANTLSSSATTTTTTIKPAAASAASSTAGGDSSDQKPPEGSEPNGGGGLGEPGATPAASQPPSSKQQEPELVARQRDHLRLFFVLVPALTMNYIDYIINCKERVLSRSSAARFGALISDDGFPMGVAFLLTVLGQADSFAGLEWFGQVRLKLAEDKREVEQRCSDLRYEESLRQTSSMTLRRLQRLYSEYEALEYTLSSALLFFRSSTFGS